MNSNRNGNPGGNRRRDSGQAASGADIHLAMDALHRLLEGDYAIGLAPGSIVGLDTAVVVIETAGGVIPLFAYLNADLRAVLRNQAGVLAAPVEGGSPVLAS